MCSIALEVTVAAVRYLVKDVEQSIAFYVDLLGFELEERMGPAFAIVAMGDLKLWLAGPQSSAAKPMPDGRQPEAGGWNRIVLEVDDIQAVVDRLTQAGAVFRNSVLSGVGGKQIVVDDPSGNPIEIFQSK